MEAFLSHVLVIAVLLMAWWVVFWPKKKKKGRKTYSAEATERYRFRLRSLIAQLHECDSLESITNLYEQAEYLYGHFLGHVHPGDLIEQYNEFMRNFSMRKKLITNISI